MALPRSADCFTLVEIAPIGNDVVTASVGKSESGNKAGVFGSAASSLGIQGYNTRFRRVAAMPVMTHFGLGLRAFPRDAAFAYW
jgi:hypothetical protein